MNIDINVFKSVKAYFKSRVQNIKTPINIKGNFISITDFNTKYLYEYSKYKSSLVEDKHINGFSDLKKSKELDERLHYNRKTIIPWLHSVVNLQGLKILEIGCGNGMSTIALSEQGACVTAVEVDESLINDAKIRCNIYKLNVEFAQINAQNIADYFQDKQFDMIMFNASLEHMTIKERLKSLEGAYSLLLKDGFLCINGSPNRLYLKDNHTSFIPFFHWLPDELAMKYAKYSTRGEYKEQMTNYINDNLEEFYRWGRGISFHEIELAIKPLNELNLISNLSFFIKSKSLLYKMFSKVTTSYKYESFMKKEYPKINSCFFQPYINIIIRK